MDSKERLRWREIFFQDNFNVDRCLAKYTQKTDLESLRKELKEYAVELHQQMADILKTETETIVNLAEYLTNLNSKIDELSLPVSQLQEEIKTLYSLIKMAKEDYEKIFEATKVSSVEKNNLEVKSCVINCCIYITNLLGNETSTDLDTLYRAVGAFSFQKTCLEEAGLMCDEIKQDISGVDNKLISMVNTRFLNAVRNNDEAIIECCLHMYDDLGRHEEAETIFQVNIVRPKLQKILCEKNLAKHNQNVNEIYKELLEFMAVHMDPLLAVLKRNPQMKPFNFILKSFWSEVDKQSRTGLPHITAPGNPDLFQKRFLNTWDLCKQIALKYGDPDLIKKDMTFQDYIKRFNLPVYFEIRFQQIAGKFEKYMLLKPNSEIYAHSDRAFKLTMSSALCSSISTCFGEEVFLEHLSDQFFKLSMLLLARYMKWFDTVFLEENKYNGDSENWELFIINTLIDFETLHKYIGWSGNELSTFEKSVYAVIPKSFEPVVLKALKNNSSVINKKSTKVTEYLENLKIKECLSNLQNVGAIPRLYRRTNKTVPKEPSNYMMEAVKIVTTFHSKFQCLVGINFDIIIHTILEKITKEYLVMVEQVLESVCKTEESLRRLKSRTFGASEDSGHGSDVISDETKIREQIKLDVLYFIEKLHPLGASNSRETMDLLKRKAVQ